MVEHWGSYGGRTWAIFPSREDRFFQIRSILFPVVDFYHFLVCFSFFPPIVVFFIRLSPTACPSYSSRNNFGCFPPSFCQDLRLL